MFRVERGIANKIVKSGRPTFEWRPSACKNHSKASKKTTVQKIDNEMPNQMARDGKKPSVFVRLYLNLYSKKFKKNANVIQVKKSMESIRKQKERFIHSVQKKQSRRFETMTNCTSTPLRYSEVSRLIRFDNTRRSMFEDSAKSKFSASSYDPENRFSQILRDLETTPLKSTVKKVINECPTVKKTNKWEYVSIFDHSKGEKCDFVCFQDDELNVKPEHSEVPKLVGLY